MRIALESRNAVTIMGDWINAGVVSETALSENIEGPERLASNGIAGSAVEQGRHSGGIADSLDGLNGVGAELLRREIVYQAMSEAMTSDLMAPCDNFSNQAGVSMGDPTEHEEGTFDGVLIQQIQKD